METTELNWNGILQLVSLPSWLNFEKYNTYKNYCTWDGAEMFIYICILKSRYSGSHSLIHVTKVITFLLLLVQIDCHNFYVRSLSFSWLLFFFASLLDLSADNLFISYDSPVNILCSSFAWDISTFFERHWFFERCFETKIAVRI